MLNFLIVHTAQAQTVTLQGYVKNTKTNTPVPYANVYIVGGNIGVPTNDDGLFVLKVPDQFKNAVLKVSCIGYESYIIPINNIGSITNILIKLNESENTLKEITISADSPAEIVAKAYQNISLNYSRDNTLYTGFYRESNLHHQKDSAERYFYVIEAVTKLNKPSYEKRLPEGEIKILEVRKNQFVNNEIKFQKWIAGAFTPIRFDVAKKRFDFIDPDKKDRYTYQLEDYTTYYDREVYKISFKPAKNSADYEGVIYIDTDTYAIVKVDYQFSEAGLNRENANRNYADLLQRQFKVNYQPINGKWYIQSVWQQANGYDKLAKDYYRYITEYATTRVDTNTYESFDYADKIQWGEVFLTKNDKYDENFWKDYNVVAQTKDLKNLLIDTTYQNKIKREIVERPLQETVKKSNSAKNQTRFRPLFSWTSYVLSSQTDRMNIQYSNFSGSFSVNESLDLAPIQTAWSSSMGIEYDIYKKIYVIGMYNFGFSNKKISGFEIGLGNRFLLSKPQNRPVHLSAELNYTFSKLLYKVADYQNNNIEVESTTFDKNKVRLELFNQQMALKLKLGIQVELSRSFLAFGEVGYFIPIIQKQGLVFSDENKNGALGTIGLKKSEIDFHNPSVNITLDGKKVTHLPFKNFLFFNIGFKGFLKIRL